MKLTFFSFHSIILAGLAVKWVDAQSQGSDSQGTGQQIASDLQGVISQLQNSPEVQSLIYQYNSATGVDAQSIHSQVLSAANSIASGAASLVQIGSTLTRHSSGAVATGSVASTSNGVQQVNPSDEPLGPHISASLNSPKPTAAIVGSGSSLMVTTSSSSMTKGSDDTGMRSLDGTGLDVDTSTAGSGSSNSSHLTRLLSPTSTKYNNSTGSSSSSSAYGDHQRVLNAYIALALSLSVGLGLIV